MGGGTCTLQPPATNPIHDHQRDPFFYSRHPDLANGEKVSIQNESCCVRSHCWLEGVQWGPLAGAALAYFHWDLLMKRRWSFQKNTVFLFNQFKRKLTFPEASHNWKHAFWQRGMEKFLVQLQQKANLSPAGPDRGWPAGAWRDWAGGGAQHLACPVGCCISGAAWLHRKAGGSFITKRRGRTDSAEPSSLML